MKKIEMIKSHEEFRDMIHHDYAFKNHNYNIYIREGKYEFPHFGIAVSKKLGNAVTRNKLKRRMRVILDEWKSGLSENKDYIIIMKENVNQLSFSEMRQSFLSLMKQEKKNENKK